MKRLGSSEAGKGCGGDRLTASPLTPLRPSGIIGATSWPGGAVNTPGRGATCQNR